MPWPLRPRPFRADARALAFVLLFGGLAAVNIRGVRQGQRVAVTATVAKLLPLLLLVAVGTFAVQRSNLAWSGWPTFEQLGAGTLLLFFAFGGVESALTPSGEIRDPARTVPRAILGATGAIVLLYIAIQFVAQGVLGSELAQGSPTPLVDVAQRLAGTAGRGHGRGLYGRRGVRRAGRRHDRLATCIPGSLGERHAAQGRQPNTSPIPHTLGRHPLYAVFALLLTLSGGFKALAVLSGMALLLVYLAVCLAALQFRYRRPPVPGSFRAPGGPTVALLASAVVIWVLTHSTRRETLGMAALIVGSVVCYLFAGGPRSGVHRMADPLPRLVAALADHYRIERELGQGGMATVYLAQDLKHERKVALKVLKPELAAVIGAERFVQEIKTTAALQHPHILPLFDSGTADGFLYYVMPFIDGETLRDQARSRNATGHRGSREDHA